ncbi:hypothetical protein KKE92_02210 [Candidatus Micrarchaeota archaeon]|nr:hypothetical protein [Candidatus Micrarchaeota archaeon]MBU1681531.1 hypothetical protein [Candidatus Micrarchaeota archaeon]
MVQQLQLGSRHIFPKGSKPEIKIRRKHRAFQFRKDERLLISKIARQERQTELGDGVKLSAHNIEIVQPSEVVIDVTDLMWSELLGIQAANSGNSKEEVKARESALVLISRNFIISQDGYVLISHKREYTTPLNGFVDSEDMVGNVDSDLITTTVLKELDEEYAIQGEENMVTMHSVEAISRRLSAVFVLGSVSLPLDFEEIMQSQKNAKDAWENQFIHGIEHTAHALGKAAERFGEPFKGRLEAYISRTF